MNCHFVSFLVIKYKFMCISITLRYVICMGACLYTFIGISESLFLAGREDRDHNKEIHIFFDGDETFVAYFGEPVCIM